MWYDMEFWLEWLLEPNQIESNQFVCFQGIWIIFTISIQLFWILMNTKQLMVIDEKKKT